MKRSNLLASAIAAARSLAVVALLALTARCGAFFGSGREVVLLYQLRHGTTTETFHGLVTDPEGSEALRRTLAARLNCSAAATQVEVRSAPYFNSASGLADGCGSRLAWMVEDVRYLGEFTNVPGYVGLEARISEQGLYVISSDTGLADENGYAATYAALNAQAARDLECPRDRVLTWFGPSGRSVYTPIAEGCGQRVTYIPMGLGREHPDFVLASRLALDSAHATAP